LDIEARAIMDEITFSAETVKLLAEAVVPKHDTDLPSSYRVTKERALMQDRVDGHRQIIRDLRSQLVDGKAEITYLGYLLWQALDYIEKIGTATTQTALSERITEAVHQIMDEGAWWQYHIVSTMPVMQDSIKQVATTGEGRSGVSDPEGSTPSAPLATSEGTSP
jgi:hypothetical protein